MVMYGLNSHWHLHSLLQCHLFIWHFVAAAIVFPCIFIPRICPFMHFPVVFFFLPFVSIPCTLRPSHLPFLVLITTHKMINFSCIFDYLQFPFMRFQRPWILCTGTLRQEIACLINIGYSKPLLLKVYPSAWLLTIKKLWLFVFFVIVYSL